MFFKEQIVKYDRQLFNFIWSWWVVGWIFVDSFGRLGILLVIKQCLLLKQTFLGWFHLRNAVVFCWGLYLLSVVGKLSKGLRKVSKLSVKGLSFESARLKVYTRCFLSKLFVGCYIQVFMFFWFAFCCSSSSYLSLLQFSLFSFSYFLLRFISSVKGFVSLTKDEKTYWSMTSKTSKSFKGLMHKSMASREI